MYTGGKLHVNEMLDGEDHGGPEPARIDAVSKESRFHLDPRVMRRRFLPSCRNPHLNGTLQCPSHLDPWVVRRRRQ